ncbi:hypothetical protein PHLCEN_2v8561 [Hermanssonia centrifuga]|uniref:Uncharacterized protein n=1 Tax=Hermanssonia centrifuga TaxID=98765 RepID=A0A2R6NTB0_9APHY|nr:hypothetical protein PHLCEN_2v8561 [Hermanssonia centrifuga]
MSTWTNGRALCFEQTPGHGPSTSGSSNRVATPFYTYHNAEDYMHPRLDVGIDDNNTWFQITDLLENAENVGTWLPTYIPKDETNHYASSVTEDHTATISRSYVDEQSANYALVSFSATLSESSPETRYTDSLGTPRETTQEIVLEPVPAKPGSANASQQTQAAGPSRALVDSTTPTIPDPSHTPPSSSKTGPAKRKQTVRKKPAAVPTKPKRVKPRQVSQAEIDEQMFLAELRRREQEEARALKKSLKRPRKSRAKRPIKPPSPPPVAQDDPPIPSLPMASTDHARSPSSGLGHAMTPRAFSSSRQVAYTSIIDENFADGLLQSIHPYQLQPQWCDTVQANILNTPQNWSHIVGMQTGTSREQSSGMINFAPTATTSTLSSPAPYTPPKEFVDLTDHDPVYDLPSHKSTWQKPILRGDWGLPVETNCDEPPAGPASQEQATTGSDPNASTLKRKADAAEELEDERPERKRRRYTPNEMKPAIGTLVNEERNGFRHVGSELLGQYGHIQNAVPGPPSYFNPYPTGFCVPMLAPNRK